MASSLTSPATSSARISSSSPSHTAATSSSSLSTSGSASPLGSSSSSMDPVSAYQRQIYMHTKKQMEAATKMSRRRSKKSSAEGPDAHASLRTGGSTGSSEEGSDA